MSKRRAIKKLWGYIKRTILIKKVNEFTLAKPKNESLQLLNATVNLSSDRSDVWFSALAILCKHEPVIAGKLLKDSATASGHPITNMTKAELIDAIASGSKLTKADAG